MTTTFKKKIKILQEKFFLLLFQTNINNITNSFIFLTMLFDLCISKDEVRQTIKRIKADKASNVSDILNRTLQTNLAELILILMSLFNVCVIHRYHSKQFKKTQMIVLCKLKKSNYIDSKTYWLITLLDIMRKVLKSIMIKRLSNIVDEQYSWDLLYAIWCLNESKMQMICDLNIKFTSRSDSHDMKLQN